MEKKVCRRKKELRCSNRIQWSCSYHRMLLQRMWKVSDERMGRSAQSGCMSSCCRSPLRVCKCVCMCVCVRACMCMCDAQREQSHLSVSAWAGARAVLLPAPLRPVVRQSSAHSLEISDGNVTHLTERERQKTQLKGKPDGSCQDKIWIY